MIRFESVSKSYSTPERGAHVAVDHLSLEVAAGETVCLIGPSGCGKTTTLRLLNRLEEPSSGRVLVGGADVARIEAVALRRRMGYVIQSGGLFPHMTVADNIGLLCRLEGWDPPRRLARVDELLELVRLDPLEFAQRFPGELSGGQRQRVGVARALALDPEILLLDEPFGALDPITRDELQEEFAELESRVAKTIVMVSHDLDEAFRLGDRVALMADGKLLQIGTLDDFRDAPANRYVERFLERHLDAR